MLFHNNTWISCAVFCSNQKSAPATTHNYEYILWHYAPVTDFDCMYMSLWRNNNELVKLIIT